MTAEIRRELLLTNASTIRTRRQKWLWQDRIPLGTVTVFAGQGGEGKSTFALHTSAQAIEGLLPGDLLGVRTNVVIISHEDDWATVMKPRLIAASANPDNVYKLGVRMVQDETTQDTVPALPIDIEIVRQGLEDTGARVLIIDPISSSIGGDLHKVSDVRAALDPLANLAQELEVAVIAIMHFNKGAGNLSQRLSGSHAFRDVSRSVLLFATDDETGQRIVSVDKSNYSAERGSSFAFNLRSVEVPTDDGASTTVAQVEYLGDTETSVADVLARSLADPEAQEERNAAQAFILDFLKQTAEGEAAANEIIKAGRVAGFSDTDLKNARKRSRNPAVSSQKSSFSGGWVWALTFEGVTDQPQGVNSRNGDTFDTFADPVTPSGAASPPQGVTEPLQGVEGVEGVSPREADFLVTPSVTARCRVCDQPLTDAELLRRGICATWDTPHIQAVRKEVAA